MQTMTKRSADYLKAQGWRVAIVERWNSFAHIRQDLFGFGDIIARKPDGILLVQTTSDSNFSARRHKMLGECREEVQGWLEAKGMVALHGWAKKGPRGKRKTWTVREEFLTLPLPENTNAVPKDGV